MSDAEEFPVAMEHKFLALLDKQEAEAFATEIPVEFKRYGQLADIYHYHKRYHDEAQTLVRYIKARGKNHDDLLELNERIDRVMQLAKLQQANNSAHSLHNLPDPLAHSELTLQGQKKTKQAVARPPAQVRVNPDKPPFASTPVKVLCLSCVCTGKSDHDELVQIAMVLLEYDCQREKPGKILQTYQGIRHPHEEVTPSTLSKYAISHYEEQKDNFDLVKIQMLFQSVNMVVSYSDADVERKLLATMLPTLAIYPWYSAQKDIPWKALGYPENNLGNIALDLGEKSPKTSMERANAICRILQKQEPNSNQIFLERLYNAKPMKALQWNSELSHKQHEFEYSLAKRAVWLSVSFLLFCAAGYFALDYYQLL